MSKELRRLRKLLLKVNKTPREHIVAKALRTIFYGSNEMTEEEAYKVLGGDSDVFI